MYSLLILPLTLVEMIEGIPANPKPKKKKKYKLLKNITIAIKNCINDNQAKREGSY